MQKLDLPEYKFKYRSEGSKTLILDDIRKKYVAMTPEEWVRQNFLKYLITEKKYPASLIIVEAALKLNTLKKRCDAVVYNNCGKPLLIVECKAPEVDVTQKTFDQIARYNMTYKVNYLIVTNGIKHFCCRIDFKKMNYIFLESIPAFEEIMVNCG